MVQFLVFVGVVILVGSVIGVANAVEEQKKIDKMPPRQRAAFLAQRMSAQLDQQWGRVNSAMICPHCQNRGTTRTMAVQRKAGISGGKATAAVITGGWSLLATGLARKNQL